MTAIPFVSGTEIVFNDPASTTGPGRVLPINIQGRRARSRRYRLEAIGILPAPLYTAPWTSSQSKS